MSLDFGEAIRRMGLETGARRAVLDALACYTDEQTGLARVSRASVALHAGVSEKTAYRTLKELYEDEDLEGLVRLVKPGSGRGNPAVYAVDIARLEYLSDAIKRTGRRCFAGVGKRLQDQGLVGAKASPDNMATLFSCLVRLLRDEGHQADAAAVRGLWEAYEAHLDAMPRPERIAEIRQPAGGEILPSSGPDEANTSLEGHVENPARSVENETGKGDISSQKGDISSQPHNKDSSPSGIITNARARAREAPTAQVVSASTAIEGEFYLSAEGLIAHACLNRRNRIAVLDDLQGRLCRVSPDGALVIRARDPDDAETLRARWLERVSDWAGDIGLTGVIIDAEWPVSEGGGS